SRERRARMAVFAIRHLQVVGSQDRWSVGWGCRGIPTRVSADAGLGVGLVEQLLHARSDLLEVLLCGLLAVEDGLDVLPELVIPLGAVGVVRGKSPTVVVNDVEELLLVRRGEL